MVLHRYKQSLKRLLPTTAKSAALLLVSVEYDRCSRRTASHGQDARATIGGLRSPIGGLNLGRSGRDQSELGLLLNSLEQEARQAVVDLPGAAQLHRISHDKFQPRV